MHSIPKFCFLTLTIVITSFTSIAQKIGFVAGVNSSTQEFGKLIQINAEPIIGAHLGAIVSTPLVGRLTFSGELLYSQKGYKSNTQGQLQVLSDQRINYFEAIPELNIKIYGPISVGFGGALAFKMSEKIRIGDSDWAKAEPSQFKNSDVSLTGKVKVTIGDLFFQARYIYGLSNVSTLEFTDPNGNPLDVNEDAFFNNRTLQLGVGWMF
jgi:hypothetical protein